MISDFLSVFGATSNTAESERLSVVNRMGGAVIAQALRGPRILHKRKENNTLDVSHLVPGAA